MTGKTHLTAGVLAGEITIFCISPRPAAAAAIFLSSVFGALLPDIDHTQSTISNSSMAGKTTSVLISSVAKHRGIIHTPLSIIIFSYLIFLIATALNTIGQEYSLCLAMGTAAGMLSHIIMDSLNPSGIMWAYPFSKKKFSIAKIRTGSKTEYIILGMIIAAIILTAIQFMPQISELIRSCLR